MTLLKYSTEPHYKYIGNQLIKFPINIVDIGQCLEPSLVEKAQLEKYKRECMEWNTKINNIEYNIPKTQYKLSSVYIKNKKKNIFKKKFL